jgi:hypothetical protein
MDSFLQMIQQTAFADGLRLSTWVYPITLTLHSVGLAMVVGVLVVIDLRILGVTRTMPLLPLKRLMLVVWLAFAINATTGVMLLTTDAMKFYYSTAFRFKMSAIAIGVVLALLMNSSVLKMAGKYDRAEAVIPVSARLLAVVSILMWLTAIGFGRYMAYE